MPLPWLVAKDMIPSARKTQLDRNLIKKSVKLALDDLKDKNAGVLLSAHALKVNLSFSQVDDFKVSTVVGKKIMLMFIMH